MTPRDRSGAVQIPLLLRGFLAIAGVAGALLLVAATTATVIQIRIDGATKTAAGFDTSLSGSDRHGAALVIIAIFAAIMLLGALRGARPAMLAVAVAGVLTLGIAIISDARHIHDTGVVRDLDIAYSDATAGAGAGFHYETLGGALLLLSGGGLLLLTASGVSPMRARKEEIEIPPPGKEPDDWFSGDPA